ncbi:MAG: M48 family metallopeptidase [Sandaracinaceae bacterium]|nr:M48 family metallopeptidase [Sandaracinaceae bacterium]
MTLETSSVVFGTTTIDYTVRRTSRQKTVSIAVDPDDGVVLAAPKDVSLERLDSVVRTKAKWIASALRSASERPPPISAREFVSGETFLYAGRQHTLRVLTGDEPGAALDHGRLVVRVPSRAEARPEHVRELLERWFRTRADERLRAVVDAWTARTMLRPSKVSIAAQRRRWGSCSPSGELRLNWRIVGAGKRLVEYVVAHELTHLAHADHTPAFWRALGRVMPDYEIRRVQLREVGPRLVW